MLSKLLLTFKALYQILSFCLQHWNVGHEFRCNVFLPQLFTGIYIHNFQSHSQLVCKFTMLKMLSIYTRVTRLSKTGTQWGNCGGG